MSSTTDAAAAIRSELKTLGITSRQVSVRTDSYSLGSSIDIRIKDASVPLSVVREVAERFEEVRRCEVTGEILSGGNRFVDVAYTSEVLDAVGAPLVALLAGLEADGIFVEWGGLRICRPVGSRDFWVRSSDPDDIGTSYFGHAPSAARLIVTRMLSAAPLAVAA